MAMTLVVAYDISDDGRRSHVAAVLQAVGDRIQRSVFLVSLDPDGLQELTATTHRLIDPDEDSVYILRQCQSCWNQVILIGQAEPPSPALYWSVL